MGPHRLRRDGGRRPLLGAGAAAGSSSRRSRPIDSAGTSVGAYEPRTFRRGGALTWQGHAYGLRPASAWKERYALTSGEDGTRELALVEGKGWGKRPVRVDVPDLAALPSGLLLFTVFIVRALAEDASSAATGAATSAAVIAST